MILLLLSQVVTAVRVTDNRFTTIFLSKWHDTPSALDIHCITLLMTCDKNGGKNGTAQQSVNLWYMVTGCVFMFSSVNHTLDTSWETRPPKPSSTMITLLQCMEGVVSPKRSWVDGLVIFPSTTNTKNNDVEQGLKVAYTLYLHTRRRPGRRFRPLGNRYTEASRRC